MGILEVTTLFIEQNRFLRGDWTELIGDRYLTGNWALPLGDRTIAKETGDILQKTVAIVDRTMHYL